MQRKLDQPPWKTGQHQTTETRPQLQTSRKMRSWTPQETMIMRRCRNRSNDLIYGGRWWLCWWWLVEPRAIVWSKYFMLKKNSNGTIRDRTSDLVIYSTVP
jgi:hypothetical protein